MKRKSVFLIGFFLSGLIGWVLGYLHFPVIGKEYFFLMGFITCFSIFLFLILLLVIWKKHTFLLRSFSQESISNGESKNRIKKNYTTIWLLVVGVVLFGAMSSGFMIFRQNKLFEKQTEIQNKRIQQQSVLIESIRKGNQVFLMSNVLNKVDEELNSDAKKTLSSATIARISALSLALKSYQYLEGDSLSVKKYSPERGQLLTALSIIEMDSSSFEKIIFRTTFLEADLEEAKLRKINLCKADLRKINFRIADLRQANLDSTDLKEANFWGANLNRATLRGADLTNVDFRWADMNKADLRGAFMQGVKLSATKLRNANLENVNLRWSDLSNVLLEGANLKNVVLVGANLSRAVLSRANLAGTDMRYSNFNQANLYGADLTGTDVRFSDFIKTDLRDANLSGVIVDTKDWFEKLKKWEVIGVESILKQYKLVEDPSAKSIFYLEKKKE